MRSLTKKEQPSYIMSTETCVYIQVGLVGSLLIFGVIRYLSYEHVAQKMFSVFHLVFDFYSIGHWDFSQFALESRKIFIIQCSRV